MKDPVIKIVYSTYETVTIQKQLSHIRQNFHSIFRPLKGYTTNH